MIQLHSKNGKYILFECIELSKYTIPIFHLNDVRFIVLSRHVIPDLGNISDSNFEMFQSFYLYSSNYKS